MILQDLVCAIRDRVLLTGYVSKHFDYCERITDGGITFPAQYVGLGKYEKVLNVDHTNGNSYLRKNGRVSITPQDGDTIKTTSCADGSTMVQVTYPLRLVLTIPKSKLSDNAFSDDLLAQEIISQVQGSVSVTGGRATLSASGYDTDSLSIWKEEVQGEDHQMNFKYSYIAINITATLLTNTACLETECAYS